jgi:hypothetical protein
MSTNRKVEKHALIAGISCKRIHRGAVFEWGNRRFVVFEEHTVQVKICLKKCDELQGRTGRPQ